MELALVTSVVSPFAITKLSLLLSLLSNFHNFFVVEVLGLRLINFEFRFFDTLLVIP